jgi:mevalonate kinase
MNIKISARPLEKNSVIINHNLGEILNLENLAPEHVYSTAISTIMHAVEVNKLPALEIRISSTIPVSSGLGSSAAFAVCLTKALTEFLGFKLTGDQINNIAYKIEIFQHGTPSGIDNSVITFNKPLFFKKDIPPEFLYLKNPLNLVVADTGIRSKTRDTVLAVRAFKESDPRDADILLEAIGAIAESSRKNIEHGNYEALGKQMTENHSLLQNLGVSCDELDHLVEIAISNGALGAKLCGGGRGGNIVAICDVAHAGPIRSALINGGASQAFASIIEATPKVG